MSKTDNSDGPFRTTIEYERVDEGTWRATEPAGADDINGQGDNPREAALDYIIQLQERDRHE